MREVPVVKKDGSIHVLPEDAAEKLIKQKQAKPYANKMIGAAPKTKAAKKGGKKKKK